MMQDGTAEPVSRDQILRREREQGKIIFQNDVPCSAYQKEDWLKMISIHVVLAINRCYRPLRALWMKKILQVKTPTPSV